MDLIDFMEQLSKQENAPLVVADPESIVMPNRAPEDGGGSDIGFGHKLTSNENAFGMLYGLDWTDGITSLEAMYVMMIDFIKHYFIARDLVGMSNFDKMPQLAQLILAEYSFNGVLNTFPRFRNAIITRNKTEALTQYKRYWTVGGERKELTRRNEWTFGLLMKLVESGWLR